MQPQLEHVTQKLQSLSPTRIAEVEDFIDFLHDRDAERDTTRAALAISEHSLNAIWNNDADATYDRL